MTTPRNPDRLIRTYLREDQVRGDAEVPDHVYNAIRDGIEQTRQRVVIGSIGVPDMNKFLAVGLGAAAVVVALLIGSTLLGSSGGPPPGGAPSASADPSEGVPSASAAPVVWLDGSDGGVPVTITVPHPAWDPPLNFFRIERDGASDPPDGAEVLAFTHNSSWYVPANPCDVASTTPGYPSATVDGLVELLSAQAYRDASAPVDITVDGHAGKSITLYLPDPLPAECVDAQFCTFIDPALMRGSPDDACARAAQIPGQIDELWIVSVDGMAVIIDGAYYEGTPNEHVEEMRAIVDSISFE